MFLPKRFWRSRIILFIIITLFSPVLPALAASEMNVEAVLDDMTPEEKIGHPITF